MMRVAVIGIAVMTYNLQPVRTAHGPLPYGAVACLRLGNTLVLHYASGIWGCEEK